MQVLAIMLGVLGLVALPRLRRILQGTTLIAPWWWMLGSGAAMLAVTMVGVNEPLLHYAAAVTTLLPAAAIYGAKRPQDRGWQWIVAALLVLLLWPAGESWLLGESFQLAAQPLRSWFLVLLFVVQCGNWIITVNAGPVLLLTGAQCMLLWPQLPWSDGVLDARLWQVGSLLLSIVPWWSLGNLRRAAYTEQPISAIVFPSPRELAEWRFFRAAYGVVWGLRVTERINEVARLRGWPWEWTWSGPVPLSEVESSNPQGSHEPATEFAAWQQLWQNIFRRFLDPAQNSTAELPEPSAVRAIVPRE